MTPAALVSASGRRGSGGRSTSPGTRRRKRSRASALAGTLLRQPFTPGHPSNDLSSTPEPPYRAPAGPDRARARPRRVLRPGQRRRRGAGPPAPRLDRLVRPQLVRRLPAAHRRRLPRPRDGPPRARARPAQPASLPAGRLRRRRRRPAETMGVDPVVAVGYSMGGPIAQLLARTHPKRVASVVLCATSTNWGGPWMRVALERHVRPPARAGAGAAADLVVMLGVLGTPAAANAWLSGELSRGSSIDIAEAGRELGTLRLAPVDRGPRRCRARHRHHPRQPRAAAQAAGPRAADVRPADRDRSRPRRGRPQARRSTSRPCSPPLADLEKERATEH